MNSCVPVRVIAGLALCALGGCDSIDVGWPDRSNRIVFSGRVTNEFNSGIRDAWTWVSPREGDCEGPLPRTSAPYGTRTQHDGEFVMSFDFGRPGERCYTLTAQVGTRRHFDVDVWAQPGDSIQVNIVVPEDWGR